jgi:hypothetical protein
LQLKLLADEVTEQDLLKQQNDVKLYFQKLEGVEEMKVEEKVHDFSLIDMDVETLSTYSLFYLTLFIYLLFLECIGFSFFLSTLNE